MRIYKLPILLALLLLSAGAFAQKVKPEEILAKHLDSIGAAEARGALKSLIAVGEVSVRSVVRKDLTTQGRIVMASAGDKNFLGMSLNASNYPSERFSYDGNKAKIAAVQNGLRSILGIFVAANDTLLKESLLGGTLSTAWALHRVAERKSKISFDGTKKINDRETYVLDYSPKGGSDVGVKIYFDKETFRHVRTEYKRIASAGIGRTPDQSGGISESRLTVTEDFSDFKDVKGLSLPHAYRIFYSIIGQNGTSEIEWAVKLTEFSLNPNLDPNTFSDGEAKN